MSYGSKGMKKHYNAKKVPNKRIAILDGQHLVAIVSEWRAHNGNDVTPETLGPKLSSSGFVQLKTQLWRKEHKDGVYLSVQYIGEEREKPLWNGYASLIAPPRTINDYDYDALELRLKLPNVTLDGELQKMGLYGWNFENMAQYLGLVRKPFIPRG